MESESSGGRTTGIQLVASIVVPGLVLFGRWSSLQPKSPLFLLIQTIVLQNLPVVVGRFAASFRRSFSL